MGSDTYTSSNGCVSPDLRGNENRKPVVYDAVLESSIAELGKSECND